MGLQSVNVFRRGIALVNELEANQRDEDSEVVLRCMSAYLENLPALPDKSCKATVDGHLIKTYARVRERELKKAV
jgi:hypothetical protein